MTQAKKVLVLSVQMDGPNFLVRFRTEGGGNLALDLGPEQSRMLHLALAPAIQSATLQTLGREIAQMLSIDAPAEVPFG